MHCLSTILLQADPQSNNLRPCAFFSRQLQGAQLTYHINRLEVVASAVASMSHWRYFLQGRRFSLYVDSSFLFFLCKGASLKPQDYRLVEALSQFHFDCKHVSSDKNLADWLSRYGHVTEPALAFSDAALDDIRVAASSDSGASAFSSMELPRALGTSATPTRLQLDTTGLPRVPGGPTGSPSISVISGG
jgi:hypothetical protein